MKQLLRRTLMAALLVVGAATPAAATSIPLYDPNPTATFKIGNSADFMAPFNDSYTFMVTRPADLSRQMFNQTHVLFITFPLVDQTAGGYASYLGLVPAHIYSLQVGGVWVGVPGDPASYSGLITLTGTGAATPIPGAMLLFVTALAGLGAMVSLRRRGGGAAG